MILIKLNKFVFNVLSPMSVSVHFNSRLALVFSTGFSRDSKLIRHPDYVRTFLLIFVFSFDEVPRLCTELGSYSSAVCLSFLRVLSSSIYLRNCCAAVAGLLYCSVFVGFWLFVVLCVVFVRIFVFGVATMAASVVGCFPRHPLGGRSLFTSARPIVLTGPVRAPSCYCLRSFVLF